MQIKRSDVDDAVNAKLISTEQGNALWSFWQNQQEDTPQYRLAHMLYYFGGLLAISAVTLFVTQAWDSMRGFPLFLVTTLLFLLGCFMSRFFLRKNLNIPAGVMATFSLAIVPLAVYNIQIALGFTPIPNYHYADFNYWVNWYWLPMELATLLAGVIMLYFFDFPFLLFPIAIVLWYMSMDLFALLFPLKDAFSWRASFSMIYGLIVIACAIYMDFKYSESRKDYAFWLYIFGVMIFWGGLTLQNSDSELSKIFYCLINVAMIFVSVILNRRVFAVFGAIGILGYLGHLAFEIFAASIMFPFVLVLLGFLIIFAAAKWASAEKRLLQALKPYIPEKILRRMGE